MFSGLPAKADFPILELTPAASFANATIAASRVAAQPCVGVQSSSWPKASVHSQGVPHRRCGRSHAADHDAVGEHVRSIGWTAASRPAARRGHGGWAVFC